MSRNKSAPRQHRLWDRGDLALLRRYAATHTAAEIARMLGRTAQGVYDAASDNRIPLGRTGPAHKYSDEQAREALRRFFREGQLQAQIAADMGISPGMISQWVCGRWRPHLRKEFVR